MFARAIWFAIQWTVAKRGGEKVETRYAEIGVNLSEHAYATLCSVATYQLSTLNAFLRHDGDRDRR